MEVQDRKSEPADQSVCEGDRDNVKLVKVTLPYSLKAKGMHCIVQEGLARMGYRPDNKDL